MISERLRCFFAEERRPLIVRHLVFGIGLLPIPWFRTGLVDLLLLSFMIPSPDGPVLAFALLFWLSVFSLPLIPLFLAWSLPGARNLGLPKRSIIVLVLLIGYHPLRYYLDGFYFNAKTLATVSRIHEQFPIVWLFKHLDTLVLLALVIWAAFRRGKAQLRERVWFHWLLFICILWAVCAFNDSLVGFSLPIDLREPHNRTD